MSNAAASSTHLTLKAQAVGHSDTECRIGLRGLPVPDTERGVVDWLLAGEWPRDPQSRV